MPPTGAWTDTEEPGSRQWVTTFQDSPLRLESGRTLGPVTIAYETWGELASDASNAVLVLHALTGDSHLAGPAGAGHPTPGWWDFLVKPGGPLDPDELFIVCPNVLGGCQGTTGPASSAGDGKPWGSRFPMLTIRDQVRAELALADLLGIHRWAAVLGGSMGGMRALEWAVMAPDRVAKVLILASTAAATAEQIALTSVQTAAIRLDPGFRDGDYYEMPLGAGPARGLALARRIAHISYRSEAELQYRFARYPQTAENPFIGGRYSIEGYLDHQGEKLVRRFDANSYIVLSRAMDSHDLGRGRGGVARALNGVQAAVTVAGIDSDRLYPLHQQREIVAALPTEAPLQVIKSGVGHDAFLTEASQVSSIVKRLFL